MPPSAPSEHLFVVALPGLEEALAQEAREVLDVEARAVPGGVELEGPAGLHQEANLRLRLASRVLLRLGRVGADGLERALVALRGRAWDGRAPVSLAVSGKGPHAPHALRAALARAWGVREVGEAAALDEGGGEGLVLLGRWEGPALVLSLDTSGEPLHRRGYRQEVSRAPLRETLAAGILRLAGWDGTEPLLDPMCGSGTFLLEGAGLSRREPPGVRRGFAFERLPGFDPAAWEARRARARSEALPAPRAPLWGYDLNAGALGTARRNARRAGVTLALERRDVRTLTPPAPGPGLVVANPPYGKRVGEAEDLPALYRALGATLGGPFARWRAALLVPDDGALVAALGLPRARALPLRNGGLRCRLLLTSSAA